MHQVVNRDGLGTVGLTDPVSVRQVDTDRRSRITIAGEDSGRDDFGRNAFHFLFLEFLRGRRVVFEPLRVVRDELCALGSYEVFEVNHRLPGAGDTERIGIGFGETVDEVHAAVEVLDPSDAVFVEELQIARLIESNEFVDDFALLVVLGISECFAQPVYDVLQRFAVESAYLIDALFNLTFGILDELGVEAYPQRFRAVVLMRVIPRLRLFLGHPLTVVVSGRTGYEVHAVLRSGTLGHDSGIEHDGQDRFVILHAGIGASRLEPFLTELRQELVFAVVVVNTIGEPHAFEIALEGCKLFVVRVVRIVEVQRLARTTDAEVIASVLVKENIASP